MEEGGEVVLAGDGGGGGVRRGCYHQMPDSERKKALINDLILRALGQTVDTAGAEEHFLDEQSKPDHFLDDLRLHNPWTQLKQFAKSFDINNKDPVVHKQTPYLIILVRLAEKWADAHDGNMPSARQEKEFKDLIRAHMLNVDEENYKEALDFSYKVSVTPGISNEIRQIIDDDSVEVNSSSSDFWILVAALKEFIAKEGNGELPLEGTIPDMTSLTEYYVSLQNIYQAKAEFDCLALENHTKSILKQTGRDPDSISRPDIKAFCKNSRKLRVDATNSLFDEYIKNSLRQIVKELSEFLLTPLATIDELHSHDMKKMEKTSNQHYLLDVHLDPYECYDRQICPAIQQGDVLVLMEDPYECTDNISFLIAVGDEDEMFRTAIPVQLVGQEINAVRYKVIFIGINIQSLIDGWVAGHAVTINKEKCIINSTLKIRNQIHSCDCALKSVDTSFINHLNDNQKEITGDISRSLCCLHVNHAELISGVGSGRTELLASLLLKLENRFRIVVYASTVTDVIGLINGLHHLCLSNNKNELFCDNVLCLERKSDLGAHDEISIQSQIERAQKCFGYPGWKFFINLVIRVLENLSGNLFKIEFMQASNQLLECIRYLQSKVSCFALNWEQPKDLIMAINKINDIKDLPDDISCEDKTHCVNMLKELKNTLSSFPLPIFNNILEAKEFCITNSRIIFCSLNRGFHLIEMIHPIDCLVIDGAGLLKEAKTLAPLCLPSLQSIVLASDDQELREDTLFGRLSCFGFRKHFLLQQDRPEIPSRHLVRTTDHQPKLLRTEFSWIERVMNTKIILAPIRNQGKEETCALHSSMATTESLFKIDHASRHPPQDFNYILDVEDMKRQYKIETGYEFGKEPRGRKGWSRMIGALNCLMHQGVMGIDEFTSADKVKRIKISSFQEIDPIKDYDKVCDHLEAGNILVGAFRMSYNYFDLSPDEVYHFDLDRPVLTTNKTAHVTHAVMFVGHGGPTKEMVTNNGTKFEHEKLRIPHLVYQNSYGQLFGIRGGFGRVGLTSVTNLALVTI